MIMDILKGFFKSNSDTEEDTSTDTPSSEPKSEQRSKQPLARSAKGEQRPSPNARMSPFAARPNTDRTGSNQRPGAQRQFAMPMMPQRQPQQRAVSAPGFGQPPRMPHQGMFNPAQSPFGQPRGGRTPGGFGQPGARRQMTMFDERGFPLQRRNVAPSGTMGYLPQQRMPNRSVLSRTQGRPTRPFNQSWF